jgi:hypothetical protein
MILSDEVSIEFLKESLVQNPTPTQAPEHMYREPQSIPAAAKRLHRIKYLIDRSRNILVDSS